MMSITLIIAITFIFSALALYTVGVWSEKISGRLKWWHTMVWGIWLIPMLSGMILGSSM